MIQIFLKHIKDIRTVSLLNILTVYLRRCVLLSNYSLDFSIIQPAPHKICIIK